MMKNIFFITLLFLSSFSFCQRSTNGNGGGRPPQNQNRQGGQEREVKKFNSSDAAGVFYYNVKKVIKKLKIKEDKKVLELRKALQEYNTNIKKIAFLNSDKFNDLDEVMNSLRNSQSINQQNNSSDNRQNMRKKIGEIIRPVRKKVQDEEVNLNVVFEQVLSEKQNKKWLKYQKKQKEELSPKRPQRNQNSNGRRQRGNGQQRRF